MREMTDFEIDIKHRRVRGSDHLKYPASEDQCRLTCGHLHDQIGDRPREHRCFLGVLHSGECEFSSACRSEVRESASAYAV